MEEEIHEDPDPQNQVQYSQERFEGFLDTSAWVIGFSIKHHATQMDSDDLLQIASKFTSPDAINKLYKSFKAVKKALQRYSGLKVEHHPCLSLIHI